MLRTPFHKIFSAAAVTAALLAGLPAQAYDGLIIFGDSLSDSGNNFIAISPTTAPDLPITPNSAITTNGFIPSFPYASGAPVPVYSNGPVWATSFAAALGLAPYSAPALAGGGNFAFGGAVTGGTSGFPYSLTDQVGLFLGGTGGVAPSSFLYVVAGGGNDARAGLAAIAGGANAFGTIGSVSYQYATNVGNIVDTLQGAGAKDIVVWNAPNLGTAPAVLAQGPVAAGLATGMAEAMNGALAARLSGEIGVKTFDLFGSVAGVIADPGAYGLSNVTDACIQGACNAAEYLFWDGIHPSARGHQILAAGMVAMVVPEPQTYLLFAFGLGVLAWVGRTRGQVARES